MKFTYSFTGLAVFALLAAAAPVINGRDDHVTGEDSLDLGPFTGEGPNATPDNTHVTRDYHATGGELQQDDDASPDNTHVTRDYHATGGELQQDDDASLDNVHATRDSHISSEDGEASPDNTHVT